MHNAPPSVNDLELIRPDEAEILFPGCLTGPTAPWWANKPDFLARLAALDPGDIVLGIDSQNNLWYKSYMEAVIWSAGGWNWVKSYMEAMEAQRR
jgi:hypothetical protein